MPSAKIIHKALNPAQAKAWSALVAALDMNESDVLETAIAALATKRGIKFPRSRQRGGDRKSIKAQIAAELNAQGYVPIDEAMLAKAVDEIAVALSLPVPDTTPEHPSIAWAVDAWLEREFGTKEQK